MEQKRVNPWRWQNRLGFSQAIEVGEGVRTLYCAGQTSVNDDGKPVHAGDMRAQLRQAFDNLETVLEAAGFSLSNVVRLNYYTVDVEGFNAAFEAVSNRLSAAGCQPASTLLGVARLAFPELLVEIEATAVK